MTPISEMTLAECLEEIRRGNYLDRHELADRIHSITRWIPISERMPTDEDGDIEGNVLIRERENESPHRIYHRIGHFNSVKVPDYFYTVTHWRRIDTP